MDELIEHCMYESGLTAHGCWDELDDYAKEAIQKFAELITRESVSYNDASMLELRLRSRIEDLEEWIVGIAEPNPSIPKCIQESARDILAKD
jgi:hypothetical protein